jgi:NADPH-dependent 2,4-dienoyl-CoA reductase/sulfur reductase-like enzyme
MHAVSRRQFLARSAATVAALGWPTVGFAQASDLAPKTGRRVIVIGGGWSGATAAKYIRLADPGIEVILLEPNREFISCPLSNLVLSGVRTLASLTMPYDGLRRHGVTVRHEAATAIEPDTRRVRVGAGYLEYDRLIVAPGIDFQLEQIDGLAAAGDRILHAWKAGPQTVQLAQQIQAMPDGGVFVMTIPPAAYRCPPGPYERACQVAWYLKSAKPRSKVLVLDANQDVISKPGLFKAAWRAYPNLECRASMKVTQVDPAAGEVVTELGDRIKYDVANVIPPQRAGSIAVQADLVAGDKRWCEVDHVTYESVKAKGVHVVGDATIGIPVPKSGTVANSMGKIVANAVVSLLQGRDPAPLAPINTCYSWVSDREVMGVINAYRIRNRKVEQIEQKLTPGQSEVFAQNALSWATNIWQDILG